ncbi:MAG: tRNA (adenosine(37)-N6)-threonylcarbamoyltransferase complex transferase subunit TsaD [Acidimicrobiia bacterium]|nr:tRNA (adenosine(37)-N6)-threonylcarbamoyltransferase complex transferase subunit TsaD [Acidimicrobiia bacterium]MCY4457919.1 tRNA (adenosine(37)-N6)-threonylcarbamoyltransferase complex transferase subunit TsaD [Acidimicrobiaceae bacterium]
MTVTASAPTDAPKATQVLGIETSCDETAAAVVESGSVLRSSVVSSQVELHALYGGVVPEVASRAHLDLIIPVVSAALAEAGQQLTDIDAIAATHGPGLVGALLVGVSAAKSLALVCDVPFVAVNHLEAHLYAAFLEDADLQLPMLVLLVSGGHTMLVLMQGQLRYRVLGATLDDAAGEAFDKVARVIGLGYPGGPAIDRLSTQGDPCAVAFPRALAKQGWDFSFSGLKTAVANHVRKNPNVARADVAASFQEAVVEVLVEKARRAAREFGVGAICLAGGVAANSRLRARTAEVCAADGLRAVIPSRAMCTDNAAMVAAVGWHRLQACGSASLSTGASPSLSLLN